ncbi:MAG: tandem-95 repeat protein [Bdellovibrio sp.]|nr:tandem-95 repeat protein [Bdellovibrio sp.]
MNRLWQYFVLGALSVFVQFDSGAGNGYSTCVNKTDYDPNITCSAYTFIANSQADLDAYSIDFGLQNGKYRKLKINFDVNASDFEVHSPCQLNVDSGKFITAETMCIDGREGVDIGINVTMNGNSIALLSQNGEVVISSGGNVTSHNLTLIAAKAAAIGEHVTATITGDIMLESTGTFDLSDAQVRLGANITAKNLSLKAIKTVKIESNAILDIEENIEMQSTGDFATSDAKILLGAQLSARTLKMTAAKAVYLGDNVIANITHQTYLESTTGSTGSEASIRAGSQIITDNLAIISGRLVKLYGNSASTVANHFHMNGPICTIDADASYNAPSQSGNCFSNPNDLPSVPTNSNFTTGKNIPLNFILPSASDQDGDILYYRVVTAPQHGTLSNCLSDTPDLTCTYTPDTDFSGTDSFTYIANDGIFDAPTVSTVFIQINLPPIMPADQTINGMEDTPSSFSLLPAIDPDGDPMTYTLVSVPVGGTITNCLNGTSDLDCDFTPNANFNGPITFTYKANDGSNNSETVATVTLIIAPVNDLPVMPENQNFYGTEDGALSFSLLPATDIDGDPLTYTLESAPVGGTIQNCLDGTSDLACDFTPNPNVNGVVIFTYKTHDGSGDSETVTTVTIHLAAINDPPTMPANQNFSGTEDVTQTITLVSASDIDGDSLTYTLASSPTGGIITNCLNGSDDLACDFIPNQDFNGTATFTYVANDGATNSTTATTVTINLAPVNDRPVMLANQSVQAVEDIPLVILLQGAFDVDGDLLNYALLSYPSTGRLEDCARGNQITICTYYPEANFSGTVNFTYKANDGEFDTETFSTVTIEVLAANDSPTLPLAQQVVVLKNTTGQFSVGQGLDTDSPGVTYELVDLPARGTLANCLNNDNDLSCEYTPVQDDTGSVTFSYRAFDGQSYSAPSTVTIVINTPPVANILASVISGEAPLTVDFSADASIDVNDRVAGVEWDFGNGDQAYSSNVGYTFITPGQYTVSLLVTDGLGAIHTANVTINVIAPDLAPTANFMASVSTGPAPLLVNFNATTSTDDHGITLYEWDFAGLGTAQGATTSFTFVSNGQYKVKLTVTDTSGKTAMTEQTIFVEDSSCDGAMVATHANGGGKVALSALVHATVYLGPEAEVCDTAQVRDEVRIEGYVSIRNNAQVFEYAQILGPTKDSGQQVEIYGNSQILGLSVVKENSKIFGEATVNGESLIYGNAQIYENAEVVHGEIYENAQVYGHASLLGTGDITVEDEIVIDDPQDPGTIGGGLGVPVKSSRDKANRGRVNVYGNARIYDHAIIDENAHVLGNAKVYGQAQVKRSIVTDSAEVFDYAQVNASERELISYIGGTAQVFGYAQIIGSSVFDNGVVRDSAVVQDDSMGRSLVFGNGVVKDFASVTRSQVFEDAQISEQAKIMNSAKIHGTAQVNYDVDGLDISSK